MKTAVRFFNCEDADIFRQSEKLHRALTHLRYEGKVHRAKNLKEVKESADALDASLKRHRTLQEKIIFPYLSTHIPRRESSIHFLESEHEGLDQSNKKLKKGIREFLKSDPVLTCGEIYEAGIFFIAHLRHHISYEVKNIRSLIRSELRPDEKREIGNRISGWLKKQGLAKQA